MKKILSLILMLVLILALAGCGAKEPVANEENGGAVSGAPQQRETTGELNKPQNNIAGHSKTLPASYPKEILPLAVDAEILAVRENPENQGLELSYVSDNDIGTLCDYYEGLLKDAKDLSTTEIPGGYMISAQLDGVGYNIMLSEDAMDPNPKYAGKKSVYIILTGLNAISDGEPESEGER